MLEQALPGIKLKGEEKVWLVTFVRVTLASLLSDCFNISSSSSDLAGLRNKSMIGTLFCLGGSVSSFFSLWFLGHSFGVVNMFVTLSLSS